MTLSVVIDECKSQLTYTVENLRWSFFGGPVSGTVVATGAEDALFSLLSLLGRRVTAYEGIEPVWWGKLSEVEIGRGRVRVISSLSDLYNAVAVAYTYKYKRQTTDWAVDEVSISQFGRREILLSKNEITEAEANTLAYNYLELHRYPRLSVKFDSSKGLRAKLILSGLFEELNYRYYVNETGFEGYEELGSGGREVGEDDRPQCAQTFQIAGDTAWTTTKVQIRPWKYPSSDPPTDDLIVELCQDSSGSPGTVLATALYSASEIETTSDWKEKNWDTAVTLQPSTTYWIKIRRSGSVTPARYFMVDTNLDAGYPRGDFYLYYTASGTWKVANHKGHLNFRVLGETSIQSQIEYLVQQYCTEISGVVFESEIQTTTNPYRVGDSSALSELKKLLKLGSTSSSRLSCKVVYPDILYVYTEPSSTSYHLLDEEGKTLTRGGVPTRPQAGSWYRLRDIVPGAPLGTQSYYKWEGFFAEEIEYSKGEYRIVRVKGEQSEFDFGEIE